MLPESVLAFVPANAAMACARTVLNAQEQCAASELITLRANDAVRMAAAHTLIERARQVDVARGTEVEVATEHLFHGGMYARTVRLRSGVVLEGALVKIETVLILNGLVEVMTGDRWERIGGYNVLAGEALRKQIFWTRSAVEMTMIFPTGAKTVEQAEREFTDEFERLMSRRAA